MDACREEILYILVALDVFAAGDIGVRQFIHQSDFRFACQHCAKVHVLDGNAMVLNLVAGNDFKSFDKFSGFSAAVRFHQSHNHIDAFLFEALSLDEHLPGFSNPGPVPEIDLQFTPVGAADKLKKAERFFIGLHWVFP